MGNTDLGLHKFAVVGLGVADPKLLFSDPDPTWRVTMDPDLAWWVISDLDWDPTSQIEWDPCRI